MRQSAVQLLLIVISLLVYQCTCTTVQSSFETRHCTTTTYYYCLAISLLIYQCTCTTLHCSGLESEPCLFPVVQHSVPEGACICQVEKSLTNKRQQLKNTQKKQNLFCHHVLLPCPLSTTTSCFLIFIYSLLKRINIYTHALSMHTYMKSCCCTVIVLYKMGTEPKRIGAVKISTICRIGAVKISLSLIHI